MKNPILFFLLPFLWLACQPIKEEKQRDPETILAIFAHPDDETTVGPVLAKYAEQGKKVYLAFTTDGRHGITDHAGIPAGDTLIQIREKEAACACEKLGIQAPIFMGCHDGLRGIEGMSGIFSELEDMEERVAAIIKKIQPDVVVTFGPDGDSGHPDHRLTGAVTTQVLLNNPWPKDFSLYYFSWLKKQAELYGDWNLNSIHEENTNTVITFDESQEEKHFKAIQCYPSQYTQEEMDHWIKVEKEDQLNRLYFRRYRPDRVKRDRF